MLNKKILWMIGLLFLVGCSHGPVHQVKQKRFTGSWKKNFSKKNVGLSEVSQTQDSLYWGTEKGFVFRIDAATMKKKWRKNLHDTISTAVFVSGNHAYVGTQKGFVYCLEAETGRTLWKQNYQTSIRGIFAMFQEHLFIMGLDGQVIGVKALSGEIGFQRRFFVTDSFTLAYELVSAISDSFLLVTLPSSEVIAINKELETSWQKNFQGLLGSDLIQGYVSIDSLDKERFLITPYMQSPFVIDAKGEVTNTLEKVATSAPPVIESNKVYFVEQARVVTINLETFLMDKEY
ncbi:MAG: PQQ-like beta-propeller repeat protein, partial [Bdellovibrionales bacterium]|nr:PQQ-like beta-propeller repeat protein [Bdellovibrionales bacterium]